MRNYNKYIEEYNRRHANNDPFTMRDLIAIDQMNRSQDGRPDRAGCMMDSLRIGWIVGFRSAQRKQRSNNQTEIEDLTIEEKILLATYRCANDEQKKILLGIITGSENN